ncbi:unnamed protein product [Closterium sp. NIES-54]
MEAEGSVPAVPVETLHMDVWGPARVRGQGHECYFLLVHDYSRYTTVFPLRSKGEVTEVLIDWIRGARRQLSESFSSDLPVLRLHSDRGGEFSSDLLRAFCRLEGIRQTFMLPASPQQNGIVERRIGMVMDIARTSIIHAAAPHFLWPFAVQYAAHQINLQPRVSLPETTPTLRWTGKVGDASAFRVWGSQLSAILLRTSCPPVPFPVSSLASLLTHPGGSSTTPPRVVFCPLRMSRTPLVDPLPPQGPAPSGVSQVDPAEPVEVAVDSGATRGAETGGAETEGAESGGALGAAGAGAAGGAGGATGATGGAGAAGGGVLEVLLELLEVLVLLEVVLVLAAGGAAGAGAGAAGGAAGTGDLGAEGTGSVSAVSRGAARQWPYYVPLLQQVLGSPPSPGPPPPFLSPPPVQSQLQLQPAPPLPGPSPYSGPTRGLTERREPDSRPVSPGSRSASPQQQQKLPTTPLIIEADEVQRPSRQVQVTVSDEEISGVTKDGGEPEVEEKQQQQQQQQQQQDAPPRAQRPLDRPMG